MTPAIQITDLRCKRGTFLLDVPDLKIGPGTVVGLVGRNGAGKTTLLQLVAGLTRPDSGNIRVLGMSPFDDPVGVRQRVAYMTDTQAVLPLPIGTMVRAVSRFYPTWDSELAASLLDRFELPSHKLPGMLSKGEETRLRLVLALAFKPTVLLMDEPATGLDVVFRRVMLTSVLEVVRDPLRSVVVSSHDLADLERITDRIVVLRQGRIFADGAAAELAGDGRSLEQMIAEEG